MQHPQTSQCKERQCKDRLTVTLFGKITVQIGATPVEDLDKCKAQELFSYLLLHRDRPHPRENLANLLWSEVSTAQSKSYLRKALWQLQSTLDAYDNTLVSDIFAIDSEWIQLNTADSLWLDCKIMETAFALCQSSGQGEFSPQQVQVLQAALDVYRGDLLEGCFHEWCLYERERYQHMRLVILDNLINFCETQRDCPSGIEYGLQILRIDPARERTHRQLMRLYYLAGDRTGALRQYEQCVAWLHKELGVPPARQTCALYEQICQDQAMSPPSQPPVHAQQSNHSTNPVVSDLLANIQQTAYELAVMQRTLHEDIQRLEKIMDSEPDPNPNRNPNPNPNPNR